MAALPGEALPNRSQTGLFPMLWPFFATSNLPMSASVPSRRSETVISPMAFQLRLVIFTEQANHAYRPLRGRLHCAVKPIGPHLACEYALQLPGTTFGLLGVLLEGSLGNRYWLLPCPQAPQWHLAVFRIRLVIFTEQANHAYRPLRGRLHCAVKPIGPHRACEYALHQSGTAFGLLGVLLEEPSGNRYRLPPSRTAP